ncbi:hypothetical protein Bbelb_380300 [Branchiostoma belcheri]|nr:hypothetical protein Bbelb_380300 [Branchiostoma belcheri]
MDQPQTDYQERADDDVTPDVTYASIPDSSGSQSDDRCKTTNPGSSETTEDIPRVGIKNPGQSKVSVMLKTMKTVMSVTNIVLSCCLLGAVIYLGHKIGDMSRVRTRDLWGVSRTRYRLRHTTPLDCAGLSEFDIKSVRLLALAVSEQNQKQATGLANVSDWMDRNRALATCNTHLVQPQSRQCGLRMAADGLAFACCLSRHTPGLFQNSRDFLRFPTTTTKYEAKSRQWTPLVVDAVSIRLIKTQQKRAIRKIDDVAASVAQLKHVVLHLKKLEATCPLGYKKYREVCYKAIDAEKTFSESDKACRFDGGTLAMPRDAGINAFLVSLKNKMDETDGFWFGLNEKRYEGKWEWIDGAPLGTGYNFWREGSYFVNADCAMYMRGKDTWINMECREKASFICQYTVTD